MKKIVSINLGNYGSTGKIMSGISDVAKQKSFEAFIAYPGNAHNLSKNPNDIILCSVFFNKLNQKLSAYTGYNGCFAYCTTMKFLKKLDSIQPDILHLHNIHDSYINIPLLFKYIKKKNIKVIWTLHDCWAVTGKCAYFTYNQCNKWKTGCGHCKNLSVYPPAKVDRTKTMWKLKKQWFTGVQDLTIVTPSKWLANLVKQSFLKEYPVQVINNGIDLDIFKPTPSDIRERFGIMGEVKLLLGVAFDWGIYKGLDVFIRLANELDENYAIVLVGVTDDISFKLPKRIITIKRTQNKEELAQLYTAADYLINPTREDNFPTVNIEALACGTPVITFNTNGSPEIIDKSCGAVVPYNDYEEMKKTIERLCNSSPFSRIDCVNRAQQFSMGRKFEEYVNLYGS